MSYLDIHSHILPSIDDGAKTIEESIKLLMQEKENGVTSVICTPHFYAEAETLESHIDKCNSAMQLVKSSTSFKELPNIYLGHEVQYFTGISRCQDLDKLCFEGTNILLLELPFLSPLSNYMLTEIKSIDANFGIKVIIAHLERYSSDRLFKNLLKLVKNGVVTAQVNADSLLNPITEKLTLKLIKKGLVSYIASDAHSSSDRPVLIENALKKLRSKYLSNLVDIRKKNENLEQIMKGEKNG